MNGALATSIVPRTEKTQGYKATRLWSGDICEYNTAVEQQTGSWTSTNRILKLRPWNPG
jgi:hypothetical protein